MVKKQLIMEKSIELFAEYGFEATSIQQITECCGISKGAFYLHFKSKDELIFSLIDSFMSQFIADVDRVVSEEHSPEQLLYNFLHFTYSEFGRQVYFAKIFMKEQVLSFNKELLDRMQMYMTIVDKIILSVVRRQFANTDSNMHLDIMFTINGLIKSYSQLFLMDDYEVDIDELCKSIVEKVTIIAEYSNIQLITSDFLTSTTQQLPISKEQIIEQIDDVLKEIDDNQVVIDSLILLKENLNEPNFKAVIIEGLLKNIRTHSSCKWLAYLYQLYLEK